MGAIPSIMVMGWLGVAAIWFRPMSETAPASMSSCGAVIPLTCRRCASESIRVMVAEGATVRVVTSFREMPPAAWPSSRMCIRSYRISASGSLKVTFRAPVPVL